MSLPELVTSNEICEAMRFTKRTLQRRFHCPINPLPEPDFKRVGGMSMWDKSVAVAWCERERSLDRSIRGGGSDE